MRKSLIILGASGNSVDILDMVADINSASGDTIFECRGFLDDNLNLVNRTFYGLPVLGSLASAPKHKNAVFVNGIGSIDNYWYRDEIIKKTGLSDDSFVSLIHPTASVAPSAVVERGCVLFANVTLSAGTHIGRHVLVYAGSVINHGSSIGDHCCLATGVAISGRVTIGCLSFIGANAAIHPDLSIGDRTVIGMGAALITDTGDDLIMAGVPAKILGHRTGEPPHK